MLLLSHFTKSCTKCKELKTFGDFNKDNKSKIGISYICKECRKIIRFTNKDKTAISDRIYREKNKEIIALKRKEYEKNNKEKRNATNKKYYEKNKFNHRIKNNNKAKYNKDSSKKYYNKNKDIFAERNRLYYIKNKQKSAKYFKSDIGKAVARASRYKRKASIGDSVITKEDVLQLQKNAKTCYWCCKPLKNLTTHLDHYIPLSRGGKHIIENLVISCQSCNNRKHAKDPLEFANSMGKLL